MMPLVSIVIPTHRPEHFVNALNCAMSQTYKNIEIIVSDNSQTDEIHKLCQSAGRTMIYRKNVNGLPKSNIAQPLSLVSGEFVKYIFDDDLIYPNCIDSMLGCLNTLEESKRNSIGIVVSSRHVIDEKNVCQKELGISGLNSVVVIDGVSASKNILTNCGNCIGEFSTILFRSALIDKKNPENIFEMWGEDFSRGLIDVPLYLQILKTTHLLYIPYAHSAFRVHAQGGSDARTNPNFHYAVSDWMRLVKAAHAAGFVGDGELVHAAKKFIKLAAPFSLIYQDELAPWTKLAQEILDDESIGHGLMRRFRGKSRLVLR